MTARVEFIDGAYKIDDGDDEHDEDFDKYMYLYLKTKLLKNDEEQRWRMNFMDTPQSKAHSYFNVIHFCEWVKRLLKIT